MAYQRIYRQKGGKPGEAKAPPRQGQDHPATAQVPRYLRATPANPAVQRKEATPGQGADVQPAEDASAAPASEPVAEIEFSETEAQIADLFAQYDQLEVEVPTAEGGRATIQVHLAYFISTFKAEQKAELEALRKKEDLSAEEKKTLEKRTRQEKRYNLHMQVKNAVKGPLEELYGEAERKKITGQFKGGKGPPEYYQKLIQTAIDQAASAGKKKKGLPQPGTTVEEWRANVQAWIETHNVGVDCSGMVDHMLRTVAESQGKTYAKGRRDRVATVGELQAGHVFTKPSEGGEIGHVRVVENVHATEEPQGDGTTRAWLEVTLVESASSKKGAHTRLVRFPYDDPGMSMDDAIAGMQEDLGSGWRQALGERKKYTAYRRIFDSPPAS